jgi:hypothetical protein
MKLYEQVNALFEEGEKLLKKYSLPGTVVFTINDIPVDELKEHAKDYFATVRPCHATKTLTAYRWSGNVTVNLNSKKVRLIEPVVEDYVEA